VVVSITGKNKEIIQANYDEVVTRIAIAARKSGRQPDDIHLVVVTKTHPIEVIQSVIEAGAVHLGENYVEEAIPKIKAFAHNQSIHWHMIGHVQSRKAESVCDYFQYIHSIDSLKIAEKLCKFALEKNKPLHAWLEFNTSGEQTKSGWNINDRRNWELIIPDVEKVIALPGIKLWGLMTMPPYSPNREESRPYYRLLKEFQSYIITRFQLSDFQELSMGMSGDFEVAIQEGATWIRVGQAILGPRYQ
jgi:pyridoxal phosphate enzyme (YggS family)